MQPKVNSTKNCKSVNTSAKDVLLLWVIFKPSLSIIFSLLVLLLIPLCQHVLPSVNLLQTMIFPSTSYLRHENYILHCHVWSCEYWLVMLGVDLVNVAVCCVISPGTDLLSRQACNTQRHQAREPVNRCTGDMTAILDRISDIY
jgi:hypothetical protein